MRTRLFLAGVVATVAAAFAVVLVVGIGEVDGENRRLRAELARRRSPRVVPGARDPFAQQQAAHDAFLRGDAATPDQVDR